MFPTDERWELFMPELRAFGVGEAGHRMNHRTLSFRDVVDLTDERDDFRHLVPCLRVMFPAQSLNRNCRNPVTSIGAPASPNTPFLKHRVGVLYCPPKRSPRSEI